MPILPLEILQLVCEHAVEQIASHPSRGSRSAFETNVSTNVHCLSLLGFSGVSRSCREASVPYLFQSITVRTTERASSIASSPLLQYVRHIHLPAVDVLTCRRPVPFSVLKLVSGATSMRITATDPSFFLTARTLMSRLLRSAKSLDTLELYSEPISTQLDGLSIIANLVPACPKWLKALYFAMPGGQPEATGVEVRTSDPIICLMSGAFGTHFARRLPALRRATFVAPGKNPRREIPVLELIGPKDGSRVNGFKGDTLVYEFQRSQGNMCIDPGDKEVKHLESPHLAITRMTH
ncbi:F-box-like domain protein [Rhizoctonia solani]|uniref:F-box-like domain protein n=1 Tax=Rhizoctonia solani TaxID=456999 RepID=A0A8H8NYH8_9AGAM|nr:F-box-like domain protein [Rhizoctonia solani]QRW21740.1 F-box-like domain protein [Rhizoctonia solani]